MAYILLGWCIAIPVRVGYENRIKTLSSCQVEFNTCFLIIIFIFHIFIKGTVSIINNLRKII